MAVLRKLHHHEAPDYQTDGNRPEYENSSAVNSGYHVNLCMHLLFV